MLKLQSLASHHSSFAAVNSQQNDTDEFLIGKLRRLQTIILESASNDDFSRAFPRIHDLAHIVTRLSSSPSQKQQTESSSVSWAPIVHTTFCSFLKTAFARHPNARHRVSIGLQALEIFSSSLAQQLPPEYNTLPQDVILDGLVVLKYQLSRQNTYWTRSRSETTFQSNKWENIPQYKPYDNNSVDTTSTSSLTQVNSGILSVDTAYSLLERLITTQGMQPQSSHNNNKAQRRRYSFVSERDFHGTLNVMANMGRMDLAQKAVTLVQQQQKQPQNYHQRSYYRRRPLVNQISYSILLKGFGRVGNLQKVQDTLDQACRCTTSKPDIIMLNTALNAFIQCNQIQRAQRLFHQITGIQQQPNYQNQTTTADLNTIANNIIPDIETYNTMLKGYARHGMLSEAIQLTQTMTTNISWDRVTTNTLVGAAIRAKQFDYAQDILANHTVVVAQNGNYQQQHPNLEAYTELLDGLAKAGRLDRALETLQTMKRLHVEPNQYTYNCLIGALARAHKVDMALKIISYMKTQSDPRIQPSIVTYNAFLHGLTMSKGIQFYYDHSDLSNITTITASSTRQEKDKEGNDNNHPSRQQEEQQSHLDYESLLSTAISTLRDMIASGIRPTVGTINIVLHAMAQCSDSKIEEAHALVSQLRNQGILPPSSSQRHQDGNHLIDTALIRVHGAAHDIQGALKIFRNMSCPDTVAVNAFMDAACRCGHFDVAHRTFHHVFQRARGRQSKQQQAKRKENGELLLVPNVISYTILMGSLTRQMQTKRGTGTIKAFEMIQELYTEMRTRRRTKSMDSDGIMLDMALGNQMYMAIRNMDQVGEWQRSHVLFIRGLLDDIKWMIQQGQQQQQWNGHTITKEEVKEWIKLERNIRNILFHALRELGRGSGDQEDELFRKKGWNKVDSGFQLWGRKTEEMDDDKDDSDLDDFLAYKGWNDVDSGFRIL